MTDIMILEAYKDFLIKNVCSKIKLQKPSKDNRVENYDLVHPTVHIGWIPPPMPEAMLPDVDPTIIPCLIVGLDEGYDDATKASIDIRISAAVYNPGFYDDKEKKFIPDYKGYQDLLNLLIITRREISTAVVINNITSIERPIRWGMYKDQPYPYWYGFLTFSSTTAVMEYVPKIYDQYL